MTFGEDEGFADRRVVVGYEAFLFSVSTRVFLKFLKAFQK